MVEPADQSNVVFDTLGPIPIYQSETNSAALEFRILDGTDFSRLTGLTFTPVITNAPANTFFAPRSRRGVKIVNTPPVITRILDQRVGAITNFVSVPASVPKVFTIEVADVNADNNPVTTYWNFGDGTGDHMAPATSNRNGFATGSITHTFSASGTYTVIVRAEDKDNGTSQEVEFNVYVAGAPTVRILPPSGPIFEMPNTGEKDFIVVQLSSDTQCRDRGLGGDARKLAHRRHLILNQYQVVFPAGVIGGCASKRSIIADIKDGNRRLGGYGFTITPSVTATPGAQAFYTINSDSLGTVRILNEAPIIVTPVASEITGTTVAFTIAQDTDHTSQLEHHRCDEGLDRFLHASHLVLGRQLVPPSYMARQAISPTTTPASATRSSMWSPRIKTAATMTSTSRFAWPPPSRSTSRRSDRSGGANTPVRRASATA
jgi:hypothetical protein